MTCEICGKGPAPEQGGVTERDTLRAQLEAQKPPNEDWEQLLEYIHAENMALRARCEQLEAWIKQAHSVDGCGCISDLPGDNYTCTAHQELFRIANKK